MSDEITQELREAAEKFVKLVKQIPEYSDSRGEALSLVTDHFCRYCGCDNPGCNCWNDE